jgi:hypothetical protein
MDPEGLSYFTTIYTGPSYVSLISSNTQIKIYPTDCLNHFGNKTVTIRLNDQQPLYTYYSFSIIVYNLPPVF